MVRFALLVGLLISVPATSNSQSLDPPKQVVVSHSGDDRVGELLAYELREQIKMSAQMTLAQIADMRHGVKLNLVTLDPREGERLEGNVAVLSATWIYYAFDGENEVELFLTSTVGQVGENRVESVARSLVSTTDEQRRAVPVELRELAYYLKRAED
jgi:hypothetical protein